MTKATSSFVFLSTYPPRECGIATFTQDLLHASQKYLRPRRNCKVATLNVSPLDTYKYPPEVLWQIDQSNKNDHIELAKTINNDDSIKSVIIQHEYGIFGGVEGEKLLYFMENCKKPMLVTLHTVVSSPSSKMFEVTQKIIHLAQIIVVLTNNSKKILGHIYPESKGKVSIIPHGIHKSSFGETEKSKKKLGIENHIVISTFGLLSRGKGIEYVIQALPDLIKKYPTLLYLVLGETHPVIRRNEGEKYRNELIKLIRTLHLQNHVRFYDQYLDLPDLFQFLKATDIYISSSTNPNQAVSGTLSYALGSGRAVVSTEFAQAKEIVTTDIGRLVPVKNSIAITNALLDLLSDDTRLEKMQRKAYRITRPMLWDRVAKRYITLLEGITLPPITLNHLNSMTDSFGLFQFARFSTPNKTFGYTLDDNARALIVSSKLHNRHLVNRYLSFIKHCQNLDGSFVNYIDFKTKLPTAQNNSEDIEDSQARTQWALAEAINYNNARKMLLSSLNNEPNVSHLRALAYRIKTYGLLSENKEYLPKIHQYADVLVNKLKKHSLKSWIWFEDSLLYNNALLPESLLVAGEIAHNNLYTHKGIVSLEFLIHKTFSNDMYMPIGHSNWYTNKKKRSQYDQQPEDPYSMIAALSRAYKITHNNRYKNLARRCFSWFLGNNSLQKKMYNEKTGGCYDGLHPDRVNLNQGAESLVSYLLSRILIEEINENN